MEYILHFWNCYFMYFFKVHIYFQKSMHISHNIPESQNLIHNVYRVRDFEFNKINSTVLASKLGDL